MTMEDAEHILKLNQNGRYRGERSRLIRAIEIVTGDVEPEGEDVETVFGVFDIGGECG